MVDGREESSPTTERKQDVWRHVLPAGVVRRLEEEMEEVANARSAQDAPAQPKIGEVSRLAENLALEVDRLDKDIDGLLEKLAPALMPSLLDVNQTEAAPVGEGTPLTQLGRKLRETTASVSRLRIIVSDLTARAAL